MRAERETRALPGYAFVDHVGLSVSDLDAAVEFFTAVATRLEGFATTGEWPQSDNAPLADFGDGPDLPATGTVNIAGPASRLGESELLSFMPDLLAAANELSVSWPAYRYIKQQDRLAE